MSRAKLAAEIDALREEIRRHDRLYHVEAKPEITDSFPSGHTIRCSGLSFSYEPDREILHSVDLTFPQGSFTALVGESGCGKSTLASILMGRNKGYTGSVSVRF